MGGIGIGLVAAGYKVAAAYDSWVPAVKVYNHNVANAVASRYGCTEQEHARLEGQIAYLEQLHPHQARRLRATLARAGPADSARR